MLMHKILQNHLLCAFVANLKIDAIYTLYPESFCDKNLAIRKVFDFSDSGAGPFGILGEDHQQHRGRDGGDGRVGRDGHDEQIKSQINKTELEDVCPCFRNMNG